MRKVLFRIFFILIAITAYLKPVFAQSDNTNRQGLDDFLYNGKLYAYYPPYNVLGNQFLESKEFVESTLWIKGDCYSNVLLNYDILNQELVLLFKTNLGAQQQIALSMAYIDSFKLGRKVFIVERDEEDNPVFIQEIKNGSILFQIHWSKTISLQNSASGSINYEFSKANRKVFFIFKGQSNEMKRNNSFKKIFPKAKASYVIKYLKKNKMNLSNMQDSDCQSLLLFISSIVDDED